MVNIYMRSKLVNKTLYNISKASRHLMIFLLFKVFFRYGNYTSLMFLFISVSCHLSRQNAVLQVNSRIFREIATFTSILSSINNFLNIFLVECTVCLDIVHPRCVEKTIGLGQINHDLSNSWECAKCSNSGYSTVPSRQR